MSHPIEKVWRTRGLQALGLWPLSQLYRLVIFVRRLGYNAGWFASSGTTIPVVVVGNLSIGGTGKTPLTAHLVEQFKRLGWRPAIVARGYGGKRHVKPHLINDSDQPVDVGDEPLMLFQQTGVPVCVCVKRSMAVSHVTAMSDCDIIFSDDGLQHLAMQRDAEIVVVDGERGFGNGWLLPAGPLREPAVSWRRADVVAVQGAGDLHSSLGLGAVQGEANALQTHRFTLQLSHTVSLRDAEEKNMDDWHGESVIAMAGIGYPRRFFTALSDAGLDVIEIAKPDHHEFTLSDFDRLRDLPVLVTSKDAVKLRALSVLPVEVFEVKTRVDISDRLYSSILGLEASLRAAFVDTPR